MNQLSFDLVRTCTRCKKTKLVTEFTRQPGGWYASRCKLCIAEVQRLKRKEDPERFRAADRRKYEGLREDPVRLARKRETARNRYYRIRAAVFAHYGEACACCGSTEDLQIDHVSGDGKEDHQDLYFRLHREGFPDGFQTLCWPCNNSKHMGPACLLDHKEVVSG